MNNVKRIQELERKLTQLASVVDRITIATAAPAPGSNVRIAKVVTTGTHPTTGQTFQIEFQNGTFTESGGQTPTYVKRSATIEWCCNTIDFIPAIDSYLLVWWFGTRWWTKREEAPAP